MYILKYDQREGQDIMESKSIWMILLDNVLAFTIVIIILASVINAFFRQRSRDKCLKDFKDFFITLIMKNGKTVWGKMKLFSSGVELEYKQPYYNEKDSHYEHSYIILHDELESNIQAIHRYHWDITPKNKKQRNRSIKRTYKPNIFRRFGRGLRNIINTLKDAFNKSLNLIIGQIGGKIAGGKATQDITSVGSSIIDVVGNAYDPILEKYIGRKIIMEINENGTLREYEGILKEYTTKYMELVNVKYNFEFEIELSKISTNNEFFKIVFNKKSNFILEINNSTPTELLFATVKGSDFGEDISKTLKPNEKIEFSLEKYKKIKELKLVFKTSRYIDIITPRSLIKVKHGSKKEQLSIKEMLGLDDISTPFIYKHRDKDQRVG